MHYLNLANYMERRAAKHAAQGNDAKAVECLKTAAQWRAMAESSNA